MAISLAGGAREVRVQEFVQPATALESDGVPSDVTAWIDNHPPTTSVPGGTVDKVFIPYWIGSVGSGNPVWVLVYIVWMNGH